MTTPKRNEAVAIRPYLWVTQEDQRRVSQDEDCVIACPHIASAPSDAVYLYHSDDYAALQGEVSRLRADAMRYRYLRDHAHPDSDEGFAVMRDEMNVWGKWYSVHVTGDALDAAIDALNLESPTDGR